MCTCGPSAEASSLADIASVWAEDTEAYTDKRTFLMLELTPDTSSSICMTMGTAFKHTVSTCEGARWDSHGKGFVVENMRVAAVLGAVIAESANWAGVGATTLRQGV